MTEQPHYKLGPIVLTGALVIWLWIGGVALLLACCGCCSGLLVLL